MSVLSQGLLSLLHWIYCRSGFDLRFQDLAKLIRGEVPANIDEKARKKQEDILVATLNIQDKGIFYEIDALFLPY